MGYGLASSPEIARQIDMVRTAFNVNHLAQAAALAAWGDPGHVTRTAAHNRVEVARLAGALRERGFDPAPSAANFLFFNLKRNARACADGLLAHGVIVKPWGGAHADCMRVTIGSTRDNDAFLAAFDQVLRA
jgi:histidinol-phosphate aminotransferase